MLPEKIKEVVLLLLLIVATTVVQAQQSSMTEEDVIASATELFDQGNWQEALPLYAQLVSVHPEISEYNYKFGVCTLLGNRNDRRRPIRYLNKAYRTMSDNADLLYYLGLAYYQNQEFANAMKFLNLYLAKLDPNSPQRPTILEQINACLNGMNLEHKNQIDEILSKNEFQTDNFYRAYRADDLNGSLILKPDNFVSSKEKQAGEKSFVFISEPRGTLYYSGYGENSNQRDLFKVELKTSGDWGKPEKVADHINTNFDEAYPVVTDNGETLYFSSKGHNSLGGYDVFKSTRDPQTEEFGPPENMGIGINSPFDDILFIPDNTGHGAFFASNRDNLGNGINVFRIRLNQHAFGDQQMLAEQSIQTKLEKAVNNEGAGSSNTASNNMASNQKLAKSSAPVDPQKKAANLVQQRAMVNKMADTAYLLVSNMKMLIRDLTNKRDRANMISSAKMEKAKNLEVEFDNIINELPNAPSKEEFENQLSRALKYKEDIYSFRQRADQANLIAWNLGKQIKIKDQELKQLKLDAGEVQTLSLSGDFEKTNSVYSNVVETYYAADTLTDYAQNINWINLDKIQFNIPDSEIAFAEQMREGYENQTLLAMTQAQNVENKKFNDAVPINIVDNRSTAKPPAKPVVTILEQVEQVNVDFAAHDGVDEETLELLFDVDAIEPFRMVMPVTFDAMAYTGPVTEDELLELSFDVDAIKAHDLVEPVAFETTAFAINDEDDLELNFNIDRIEASPVVLPVSFDAAAYTFMPDEESLEINDRADWITPSEVVAPVVFHEAAYAFNAEDEDLTIDFRVDWVEAAASILPVAFDAEAYALEIDEELSVNYTIDQVEPQPLISRISFDEGAYAIQLDEAVLELSDWNDRISPDQVVAPVAYTDIAALDLSDEELEIGVDVDRVEALRLVETVAFVEKTGMMEAEELEIRIEADRIQAPSPVEQVQFAAADVVLDEEELEISDLQTRPVFEVVEAINYTSNDEPGIPDSETLEISTYTDRVIAAAQVEAVAYSEVRNPTIGDEELEISPETGQEITLPVPVTPVQYAATQAAFPEEEDLEISEDAVSIQAAPVVQPVQYSQQAVAIAPEEDVLEIRIEETPVQTYALVQKVSFEDRNTFQDEELEISKGIDAMEAFAVIEPVYANTFVPEGWMEEELELNFEADKPQVEVAGQVVFVAYEAPATMLNEMDESLELSFEIDRPVSIDPYQLIAPITFTDFSFAQVDETELELDFFIDEAINEGLMADNAGLSARDVTGIPEMPAAGTELYYLRESVSMAANIETSRTDIELLRIAIEDPEDLSYEELLFAASLAPIPEDKLRIYNYAFIHIDRDWRAFNNAAVTAMNMKDLDQAEVYLYQASLISDQNGKVENNKGILACYKNDYNLAESHFLAANQMGVNADYNLQLIQNLLRASHGKTNNLKREMGNVRMNK